MKNSISIAHSSLLRDEVLEQELLRLGLTECAKDIDPPSGQWNFVKLKRSRIDRSASLKNQARLEQPLIQDWLDTMEKDLQKGKKFPAIVVTNHRYELSKDAEFVNAYVVNFPSDTMRRHFTKTANDKNGERNMPAVKLNHAATEVETFGMSVDHAAKLFGVSRSQLRDVIDERTFQQCFGTLPKAGTLHETVKKALGEAKRQVTLIVAEEMTKAAIASPGVTANQIKAFSDAYRACKTPDEQRALLADIPNRFVAIHKQKTNGGDLPLKSGRNVLSKTELLNRVDKLIAILRMPNSNTAQTLTPEEVTRVSVLHKELGELLGKCQGKKPVVG